MAANRTVIWSDVAADDRLAVYMMLRQNAERMRESTDEGPATASENTLGDAFDALANLLAAQDAACAHLSREGA